MRSALGLLGLVASCSGGGTSTGGRPPESTGEPVEVQPTAAPTSSAGSETGSPAASESLVGT
jgi:hypothetical protein